MGSLITCKFCAEVTKRFENLILRASGSIALAFGHNGKLNIPGA
jgi:hypothetical protein